MPQVSDETNDIVYYELRRFVELLSKNNPNIIEMLNVPEASILYRHKIMNRFKAEMFLSKLCEKTFANYAYSQIKKAYGLEKKMMRPIDKKRKTVLDFCFVHLDKRAVPLMDYLEEKGLKQEGCGLSAITHMRDCYNLYYSGELKYSGLTRKPIANDVCVSSIAKEDEPIGLLYFNKDGYSVYCKRYKEYWDWVSNRNEERYNTTMSHGKNYDSKNMMHVFRLLLMARDIAIEGSVNVYRKDRDFLLDIKQGKFEYDDLVDRASLLKSQLAIFYQSSSLVDSPDMLSINDLLFQIRKHFYAENE